MANRPARPAFHKPFHQLSPQERVYYIDWVDQHYRAFFVGDVPRPGPRPAYPEVIRADKAYNWRSPEAAAYLGTYPQSLNRLATRRHDPLPRIKDNRSSVHYCEADVVAWAERNGYGPKNNA